MKVIITEIQNPSEALAALGLTRWLADLSIDSDITGVPVEISRKMLSADMGGGVPEPVPAAAAPPAKHGRPKKYAKKAKPVVESKRTASAIVEKASRKPVAATSEEKPHVTLIAAAPELLESLKGCIEGEVIQTSSALHPSGMFCMVCGVNSVETVHNSVCRVGIAEAVIAKAEGRS